MDLIKYAGLRVKVVLKNNYYYIGVVLNAEDDSIDLKDVKGNFVSLSKDSILTIQEVKKNG